jgi:hypothetical protein
LVKDIRVGHEDGGLFNFKAVNGSLAGEKTLISADAQPGGAAPEESTTSPAADLELVTLYSIADACVIQGYPSVNFGNNSDMWSGYDDSLDPDGEIVRSLIKFDIASLPAGKTIQSATLRLYLINSWDFPGRYRRTQTYRVTSNWLEGGVTWNNGPGYGTGYGGQQILHTSDIWMEFDVTGLVEN